MGPMCFNWMWMFPLFPIFMMGMCLLIVWLIFGRGRLTAPCCGHDSFRSLPKNSETAMEILKKRYAGGEINKDEFERIKKELMN